MKEEGPLEIRQNIAKFQNSYYDLQEDMGEMIDSMNMLLHRIQTIEEFIEHQGILSCPNKSILDGPTAPFLNDQQKKVWDAWIESNGIKEINSLDELTKVAERFKEERVEEEKRKIRVNTSNEAYYEESNSYRVALTKFYGSDFMTKVADDLDEANEIEEEEDFVRWLTDWISYATL